MSVPRWLIEYYRHVRDSSQDVGKSIVTWFLVVAWFTVINEVLTDVFGANTLVAKFTVAVLVTLLVFSFTFLRDRWANR